MNGLHCGIVALLCFGCTTTPSTPARAPDGPPDVLVLAIEDHPTFDTRPFSAATVLLAGMPIHPSTEAGWAALLAGQWPGTRNASPPNTVHSVLRLYGYETFALTTPALDAAAKRGPWLTEGLQPLKGPCAADAIADFGQRAPAQGQTALFAVVGVSDGPSCPSALDAARVLASGRTHPLQLIITGLNDPTAKVAQAEPRAPLVLQGPGWTPARVHGQASILDVLPTALAVAGAVTPSDADGVNLLQYQQLGKAALSPILFLQDADNDLLVRTSLHRLLIPAALRPLLDPTVDIESADPRWAGLTAENLDGTPAGDAVRTTLLDAARSWERSLTGTTASDRAGADTLRAMLAEQGYWK